MRCFCDLHVHLGRAMGGPVKVTASRALDLSSVLEDCLTYKGLDMVGVVDLATNGGLQELEGMLDEGVLQGLSGGGFRYKGKITLIAGAEVEVGFHDRPVHMLVYVEDLDALRGLGRWYASKASNPALGVQRAGDGRDFLREVGPMGLVVPAHAFTPFRGFYAAARTLGDALGQIAGLEMGLSADTSMADRLLELESVAFLSNSDAHSLLRIAREHNILCLLEPNFREMRMALTGRGDRYIAANVGLDPRMGKYHRSCCDGCGETLIGTPPLSSCPRCGSDRVTKGVLDRVTEIADRVGPSPDWRPPYKHIIPPYMVPGLGPRALARLLEAFGTEMRIVHGTSEEQFAEVLGSRLGSRLAQALSGKSSVHPGGGGRYGQVLHDGAGTPVR